MSVFDRLNEPGLDGNYVFEELLLDASSDAENLARLTPVAQRFGLHPLTIEDCIVRNQRAKLETFPEYLFMVWHFYDKARREPIEVHLAVSRAAFLVVATTCAPRGMTWRELFFGDADRLPPLRLAMLQAVRAVVDHAELYFDILISETESLEDRIVARKSFPKEIIAHQHLVRGFSQSLSSAVDVLTHLRENLALCQEERFLLRSIVDNLLRVQQSNGQMSVHVFALFDMYWGTMSTQTNEQMKRLTALATLVVPATLWTGFFGMNFQALPFEETWFLYFGLGVMALSVIAVLVFLARTGVLPVRVRAEHRNRESRTRLRALRSSHKP